MEKDPSRKRKSPTKRQTSTALPLVKIMPNPSDGHVDLVLWEIRITQMMEEVISPILKIPMLLRDNGGYFGKAFFRVDAIIMLH